MLFIDTPKVGGKQGPLRIKGSNKTRVIGDSSSLRRTVTLDFRIRSEWDVVMPITADRPDRTRRDRKSTRLNSSHVSISYAVFCLKKKNCTGLCTIYRRKSL